MKLLGWVHRKLWHVSGGPMEEFGTVVGPTCNCLGARSSLDARRHRLAPPASDISTQWMLQESVTAPPIPFTGLLTIGTFGSPIMIPTDEPTLEEEHIPVEAVEVIAEKETEDTTEKDLKVVEAELEKVLAVEVKKEKGSGDQISSASANTGVKTAKERPLQEFLLSLPVEMGSTALAAPENCHVQRASLGELFMRTRADEELLPKNKLEEMPAARMHLMVKQMLKRRRTFQESAGGGKLNAAEANKFHKILRIFHRKIYPEVALESLRSAKVSEEDNGNTLATPQKTKKRQAIKQQKNGNTVATPEKTYKRQGTSPGWHKKRDREHWIKTDADYLVLEL